MNVRTPAQLSYRLGREELEDLAKTGWSGKKDDTLPRLIDAVASGKPEEALHVSWYSRIPAERRQAEAFLGYDPQGIKRFWEPEKNVGRLAGKRMPLQPGSEEFRAVQTIFAANPKDKTYNFGNEWSASHPQILKIDRIQNPGQEGGTDEYYERIKASIERQGIQFEG